MSESQHPDKESCNRLASMIAREEGLDLVRLLESTGLLDQAPPQRSRAQPPATPRPISIWRPVDGPNGLEFVRPEPNPLGDHYAADRVIPAQKQAAKRICWFGESAAAGYLYAPHLTPAKLLDRYLQHATAARQFEVIDLARTNETLPSLVETVAASLQLAPDMIIIYAGNNWSLLEAPDASPYVPDYKARRRYGRHLRSGGFMKAIEDATSRMMWKAGRALAEIDAMTRSAAIPVVLVAPEVNLADWESRQPVVWLPGERTEQWYELYRLTLASLANEPLGNRGRTGPSDARPG